MYVSKLTNATGNPLDPAFHSGTQAFKASLTPRVGDVITKNDGSEFVLVSTDVDLTPGQLVATPTFLAAPIDNLCTAAAIGATSVTINTTGVSMFGGSNGVISAGRLAGGWLIVNDDTGEGYTYKIVNNTAGTASASVTLTLDTGLVVALDTTSDVCIVAPPYDKVVVSTGLLPIVGVACVATTAGTNSRTEYLWVQTKGICGVLITTGTSVAIGKPMVADSSGGVKIAGAVTDLHVGVACNTDTTATGKIGVKLQLGN